MCHVIYYGPDLIFFAIKIQKTHDRDVDTTVTIDYFIFLVSGKS